MPVNYASVYSSLYTLVAGDAAVLALLGANGLMGSRRELARLNGRVLPWLVWTYGPVSGDTGAMGDVFGSWWAYIARGQDESGLYAIARAVETAYKASAGLSIAGGRIHVGSYSQPAPDPTLGDVQAMQIPVYYRTLR